MSRSDKNWKNKAGLDIQERDGELFRVNARFIPVAEVSVGMKIVNTWKPVPETWFEEPSKTTKVEKREACPGNNGMHVHLNKSNCYDSRVYIWVAE